MQPGLAKARDRRRLAPVYFVMKQKLINLGGPALLFFLTLNSCAAQQRPWPDFYQGLLAGEGSPVQEGEESAGPKEAAAFFENALNSSNVHIRQAAAEKLLGLMYTGGKISETVLDRARREAAGPWAAALETLDPWGKPVKERVLPFLLQSGGAAGSGTVFPGESALYILRECRNQNADFFSPAESAAIEGHIAAARSRFGEALVFFRSVLNDDASVFLRYPELLGDLGRSFQYAAAGTEGIDLFLEWEKKLAEEPRAAAGGEIPRSESPVQAGGESSRFRLLFFAARIARQRGLADQGMELFARALPFAPDREQADACIWYILDSALGRGAGAAIQQLEVYASRWYDDAYFFDVLDKLSQNLAARRQWKDLIRVFALIRNRRGAATAQYAYIIGRAVEEGYLSTDETLLAADAAMSAAGEPLSRTYLRIAYETETASLYYRSLCAAALNEPFLELPNSRTASGAAAAARGSAMEFLLGFFNNQAAGFAPRYIKAAEKDLSTADLRTLAAALAGAGLYAESMRLVLAYTGREGYKMERRDLELQYPRPFKDLVEQYAGETGIDTALLFGLIRTESAFQSDIVSRAGAVGLTQLMPATAKEMAVRILRQGGPDYTRSGADNAGPDLQDPAVNIHIGAVYLSYLANLTRNTLLALLSYNGGMNRVRRWQTADTRRPGGGFPADLFLETVEYPETREYGRRVLAAAAAYGYLYQGTAD
jgi:soluble lytic murein transglycosylase